jgi:hypothetical protein
MYVFTFLILGEFRSLLISLVLLFSCREEFPLIGPPIALVLFLDRKPKRALGVFILSALWILFVFVLRPRWFDGHFENYGGRLIQEAISDPIAVIKKNFTLGNARIALERTLPLALVIDWRRIHQKWPWIIRALLVSAPILGIRFVSNQWGFHYGTAVVICALFMFLPSVNFSIAPWRKWLAILFLLATFIAQPIKIFLGSHSRCPNDSDRLAAIELAQARLATLDGIQLLLENNLASTQFLVSKKRQTIHLLCSPTGLSMKSFDAVLIEKGGSGDPWPCSHEQLEKMMASWRADPAVRILIDDQHVFLAEGTVTVGE